MIYTVPMVTQDNLYSMIIVGVTTSVPMIKNLVRDDINDYARVTSSVTLVPYFQRNSFVKKQTIIVRLELLYIPWKILKIN